MQVQILGGFRSRGVCEDLHATLGISKVSEMLRAITCDPRIFKVSKGRVNSSFLTVSNLILKLINITQHEQ